jgi:hypothetical protein
MSVAYSFLCFEAAAFGLILTELRLICFIHSRYAALTAERIRGSFSGSDGAWAPSTPTTSSPIWAVAGARVRVVAPVEGGGWLGFINGEEAFFLSVALARSSSCLPLALPA